MDPNHASGLRGIVVTFRHSDETSILSHTQTHKTENMFTILLPTEEINKFDIVHLLQLILHLTTITTTAHNNQTG